jgi:hypothetical protein
MVHTSSHVTRNRLAALAVAAGLAAGAAIMPAHAVPAAAHSSGHHTSIIIIGGRHNAVRGGTSAHPIAARICLWCK